jgi:hypothetical protein
LIWPKREGGLGFQDIHTFNLAMLQKREGGLGFRDIHAFNLAMLAKQGWRIIKNPEYFPNSSCLQAHPKEGIWYTWRSILKGIDISLR